MVNKGFAEVNDTRLYYETLGRGHPLVLVHGLAADTRMWDDQFEAFAKRFKVVRYDMRGFGKSALPIAGKEYSHVDDLKALLNQLKINYAHVVGGSMGGRIAIDFALEHPDVTRALILVDSSLGGFQDWSKPSFRFWEEIEKEARGKGVEATKDLMIRTDPNILRLNREKPDVAFRIKQMTSDYSGWHFVNADPCRSPDPPAIERLKEIRVPTLIIVGENDSPDFHKIAGILSKKIQNSKRIAMKGAGHGPNMETPREFNEAVLSFLADA